MRKLDVVVVGSGGHAKVCIDVLNTDGRYTVAGCVAPDAPESGYPADYLGGDDILANLSGQGLRYAVVALGDNAIRRKLAAAVRDVGLDLITGISPDASIGARVHIGPGTMVMPGAVVNIDSVIGAGVIINTGATVDHDNRIGDFCHVAPGVHLAGDVSLGEGVMMGTASCGIPGVLVGAWTIVGAGAVVIHDLPDNVTAVGVPARPMTRAATHRSSRRV